MLSLLCNYISSNLRIRFVLPLFLSPINTKLLARSPSNNYKIKINPRTIYSKGNGYTYLFLLIPELFKLLNPIDYLALLVADLNSLFVVRHWLVISHQCLVVSAFAIFIVIAIVSPFFKIYYEYK